MLLVRDTTLYFQEVGRGDSLLFIHGAGGDANIWDEQTMSLADEFRCVTYDRRGHTRSPLGTIPQPSATTHADDAAELVIALGLSPVIVVSSDRGAEISLDLARRYPGLVRGAVLSEPLISSLEPGSAAEFWSKTIRAAKSAPSPRAAVDAFFATVSGGSWERLPEARREAVRSNHAAVVSALLSTSCLPTPEDLQPVTMPVRIITGTRSLSLFQQTAAMIAERIPNANLVHLAGAGHFANVDQPQAFNEAIRSFARRSITAAVWSGGGTLLAPAERCDGPA